MSYWGAIAARAWRETRAQVRWNKPIGLFVAIGLPLVAGAAVWLLTRSPVWSAAMAVGVLALVTAATFATRMIAVPGALDSERLALIQQLRGAAAPAVSAIGDATFGDMTINELLLHINPNLRREDSRAAQLLIDLRDALSIGRLRCWGRMVDRSNAIRGRAALEKIPRECWSKGELTGAVFYPDGQDMVHFSGRDHDGGTLQWRDLQVNRAEVEAIWPKPIPPRPATPKSPAPPPVSAKTPAPPPVSAETPVPPPVRAKAPAPPPISAKAKPRSAAARAPR